MTRLLPFLLALLLASPAAAISLDFPATGGAWPAQESAVAKADMDAIREGFADLRGAVFNVQDPDYGAVGDGTTDDTAAVEAAIAAAIAEHAANGGCPVIYFPAGTYRLPSGTWTRDTQDSACLIFETDGPGAAVLDGDRATPGATGGFLRPSGRLFVRDLEFRGWDGAVFDQQDSTALESAYFERVVFAESVSTNGIREQIQLRANADKGTVVLRGNRVTEGSDGLLDLDNDGDFRLIAIGNEGSDVHGVNFLRAGSNDTAAIQSAVIVGNTVENHYSYDSSGTGTNAYATYQLKLDALTALGNVTVNVGGTGDDGDGVWHTQGDGGTGAGQHTRVGNVVIDYQAHGRDGGEGVFSTKGAADRDVIAMNVLHRRAGYRSQYVDGDGSASIHEGRPPVPWPHDATLVDVAASDNLCADSLTVPLDVWIDSGGDCDSTDGDTHTTLYDPENNGLVASGQAIGATWGYVDDDSSTSYTDGEALYAPPQTGTTAFQIGNHSTVLSRNVVDGYFPCVLSFSELDDFTAVGNHCANAVAEGSSRQGVFEFLDLGSRVALTGNRIHGVTDDGDHYGILLDTASSTAEGDWTIAENRMSGFGAGTSACIGFADPANGVDGIDLRDNRCDGADTGVIATGTGESLYTSVEIRGNRYPNTATRYSNLDFGSVQVFDVPIDVGVAGPASGELLRYDGSALSPTQMTEDAQGNVSIPGFVTAKTGVQVYTANQTLTTADLRCKTVHNNGATGAITFSLPDGEIGACVSVILTEAQDVDVDPVGAIDCTLGAGCDQIIGETDQPGESLSSDATVGSSLSLLKVSFDEWVVTGKAGTWAEASP